MDEPTVPKSAPDSLEVLAVDDASDDDIPSSPLLHEYGREEVAGDNSEYVGKQKSAILLQLLSNYNIGIF